MRIMENVTELDATPASRADHNNDVVGLVFPTIAADERVVRLAKQVEFWRRQWRLAVQEAARQRGSI